MIYYQQWMSQDPNEHDHQRRQNEARATAAYGCGKRLVQSVTGFIKAFFAAYHRSQLIRSRQAAMRELRRLDDRLLKDLGIARSEIYDVVHNGRPAMTAGAPTPDQSMPDCEILPMPSLAAEPARQRRDAARDRAAA